MWHLAAYFFCLETPGFPACYPLKGGGNTFKLILRGQNYPNTNDRYKHYKKEKLQINISEEHRGKNS